MVQCALTNLKFVISKFFVKDRVSFLDIKYFATMPPRKKMTEEEKKRRRREQKKQSMRRARARLDDAAIEERRRKDRDRYHKKKEQGLVKTIEQYTPRQQRQIRKMWRDKARKRREDKKQQEQLSNTCTPTSSVSTHSRIASGRAVIARNKRKLKSENLYLKQRLTILESKLNKYKMRLIRANKNSQNKNNMVFKGTLKVHQICWSKKQPNILHARRLSCIICAAHTKCSHYEIGQIQIETDLLHSPSKEPSSPHSASIPITLSPRPLSRIGTSNAFTTNTNLSDSPTSEGSIEIRSTVSRKRIHIEDVYSDDSDDFVVPLHRTKRMVSNFFKDSDTD